MILVLAVIFTLFGIVQPLIIASNMAPITKLVLIILELAFAGALVYKCFLVIDSKINDHGKRESGKKQTS